MKSAPLQFRKAGLTLVPPLTRTEVRLPDDPFLLNRFEDFYQEVVRLKQQLEGRIPPSAPAVATQSMLAEFLTNQKNEVDRKCTLLGVEMYRQAQRVMAAMADEIFGARAWPRDGQWPSLEAELFEAATSRGLSPGGQCLKKLDQLLRQDDPVYRELASVYFYALALTKPGSPDVEDYLTALAKMVSPPTDPQKLFPQSYAHTLTDNKIAILPSPKKWLWILAVIFAAWFSLSWVLWTQVSTPVETQLNEIRKILRP